MRMIWAPRFPRSVSTAVNSSRPRPRPWHSGATTIQYTSNVASVIGVAPKQT